MYMFKPNVVLITVLLIILLILEHIVLQFLLFHPMLRALTYMVPVVQYCRLAGLHGSAGSLVRHHRSRMRASPPSSRWTARAGEETRGRRSKDTESGLHRAVVRQGVTGWADRIIALFRRWLEIDPRSARAGSTRCLDPAGRPRLANR